MTHEPPLPLLFSTIGNINIHRFSSLTYSLLKFSNFQIFKNISVAWDHVDGNQYFVVILAQCQYARHACTDHSHLSNLCMARPCADFSGKPNLWLSRIALARIKLTPQIGRETEPFYFQERRHHHHHHQACWRARHKHLHYYIKHGHSFRAHWDMGSRPIH